MEFLDLVLLNNAVRSWLGALVLAAGVYGFLRLMLGLLQKRVRPLAEREALDTTDLLYGLLNATRGLFLVWLGVYTASRILRLEEGVRSLLGTITITVLLFQVGLWAIQVIEHAIARRIPAGDDDGAARKNTLNALGVFAKVIVWILVVLLMLDNLPGVQITSLIASLGIGGIAIGLAVQSIVSDLFSSLTIALDKPFVIGDSINVGEFTGQVEHIGLKSTRLRSLTGEQLVFSNSDLLSSRIRNFKRMERRRILFTLGVVYETPPEKLEQIGVLVREIIDSVPDVAFDRAHFKEYGPYSLNFEVVYFLETADFTTYMDRQQAINLEIYRRFAAEDIHFAYPTQTVILHPPG